MNYEMNYGVHYSAFEEYQERYQSLEDRDISDGDRKQLAKNGVFYTYVKSGSEPESNIWYIYDCIHCKVTNNRSYFIRSPLTDSQHYKNCTKGIRERQADIPKDTRESGQVLLPEPEGQTFNKNNEVNGRSENQGRENEAKAEGLGDDRAINCMSSTEESPAHLHTSSSKNTPHELETSSKLEPADVSTTRNKEKKERASSSNLSHDVDRTVNTNYGVAHYAFPVHQLIRSCKTTSNPTLKNRGRSKKQQASMKPHVLSPLVNFGDFQGHITVWPIVSVSCQREQIIKIRTGFKPVGTYGKNEPFVGDFTFEVTYGKVSKTGILSIGKGSFSRKITFLLQVMIL